MRTWLGTEERGVNKMVSEEKGMTWGRERVEKRIARGENIEIL